MTAGVIIGILLIAFALGLIVPGALATAGRLPGNSVVGMRVPEVRKDEEIWKKAHQVLGPYLILGGVALGFAAAFAFIAQGWLWVAPVVLCVVAVVAAAAGGNLGARAAKLFDEAKHASASADASRIERPAVDVDALRNAARQADGGAQ